MGYLFLRSERQQIDQRFTSSPLAHHWLTTGALVAHNSTLGTALRALQRMPAVLEKQNNECSQKSVYEKHQSLAISLSHSELLCTLCQQWTAQDCSEQWTLCTPFWPIVSDIVFHFHYTNFPFTCFRHWGLRTLSLFKTDWIAIKMITHFRQT